MPTTQLGLTPIYFATTPTPTVPSAVTPETPLESLNLNWREEDLPEAQRTKHVHRLHPYLGKFIPQLVEVFLRKYFSPGDTVLDPFCGSGTTLVQCLELGINAIGFDISAFNVMLTAAKTTEYDMRLVKHEVLDILHRATSRAREATTQMTLWGSADDPAACSTPSTFLNTWYAPKALAELLAYRDLIHEYTYKDLLSVILSRAARSARRTTHFDLDFPKQPQNAPYWCHKHRRICSPTDSAAHFLSRYSLDTIHRLEQFASVRTSSTATVLHRDARQAEIPPVSGVITSPPYVGLIDYHDQHRYAYELLGLPDNAPSEIGPAANGTGRGARQQYESSIAEVFSNCLRSMPSGGHLVVVAADRHELYPNIASLCGVTKVATIKRHVNRRTGRRSSEFFESVFIWQKP